MHYLAFVSIIVGAFVVNIILWRLAALIFGSVNRFFTYLIVFISFVLWIYGVLIWGSAAGASPSEVISFLTVALMASAVTFLVGAAALNIDYERIFPNNFIAHTSVALFLCTCFWLSSAYIGSWLSVPTIERSFLAILNHSVPSASISFVIVRAIEMLFRRETWDSPFRESILGYAGLMGVVGVLATLLFFQRSPSKPDPLTPFALQEGIMRAEEMISESNWQEAEDALQRMEEASPDNASRKRVSFSYGYLYQEQAAALSGESQRAMMQKAINHYLDVIRDYPDNEATHQNLSIAYSAIGEPEQAIRSLQKAYQLNPTAEHAVSLGDLCIQARNFNNAYRYYDEAHSRGDLPDIHNRFVSLYALSNPGASRIFEHCEEMWGLGLKDLTARALQQVIHHEYESKPENADQALLWLLTTGKGWPAMHAFPEKWNSSSIRELRLLTHNPMATDQLRWWKSGQEKKITEGIWLSPQAVIAQTLRAEGGRLLEKDSIPQAALYYESAQKALQSSGTFLTPRTVPGIFFRVAGDLCMMYTNYPETDPGSVKFKRMEELLFDKKLLGYDHKTDEAVALHTTLGLIYAGRGQWELPQFSERTATTQLTRAIGAFPGTRNDAYLLELLAAHHLRKKDGSAGVYLLRMAASLLNIDDLEGARAALARYDSLKGEITAHYRNITFMLALRSDPGPALKGITPDSLAADVGRFTTKPAVFSKHFDAIQRFKIYADLGKMAMQNDASSECLFFYGRSLKEVPFLDELSNAYDVDRLNNLQNVLTQFIRFSKPPKTIRPENATRRTDATVWPVKIYPDLSELPKKVDVNIEWIVAGQLISLMTLAEVREAHGISIKTDSGIHIYNARIDRSRQEALTALVQRTLGKSVTFH